MKKENPIMRIWEMGQSQRGPLIFSIICAVCGVILGLLPYFAAARIIVGLLNGDQVFSDYARWLLLGMVGYLGRTLLYNLALSISHKATFSILKTIRQQILEKLPRLPLGTMIDMPSGKTKQIIVDMVESTETTLAHLMPEMTANVGGPLLILICLFVLDWRMALLSLVSLPVGMVFMMTVMGAYTRDYAGAVKTTQEMNGTIVEYIHGIEVIKTFNQGQRSYGKLVEKIRANAAYYYNWMKRSQFGMCMAFSIAPATLITILPAGWLFYQGGSLTAENYITIIILSMGIAGPLLAAMNFVDTLAQVGTTVEAVDELLRAEEQYHGETRAVLSGHDVTLSHVTFGYHEDRNVLKDVSLTLREGETTALVGPSGSGKSTIAKLIAGFWDGKEGVISIGGADVRTIPLDQLYEQVAFVSQDNYLFDESVLENIRMGRSSATDREVEQAAKAAGCDAFIRRLEQGYNTEVGSGGTHLSGGERQRIAIARAMLKDAPIVILDEATAYIDPENEAILQRAIAKLVRGKTVIVIAHRLSTIRNADQIVVVEDGRIAGTGTHAQLRESCPLYEKMWQAHMGVKEGETA